jgi:putative hemolysin
MTPLIVMVTLAAIAVAAGAAAADAALTAESSEPPSRRFSASATPADDFVRRLPSILYLTRLAAYLVAGAAAWSVVEDMGAQRGMILWALLALAVVFVVEAASRAYGERNGSGALQRLNPLLQGLDLFLSPIRAPLQQLERVLERILPPRTPDAQEREEIAERFRRMVAEEAEVSSNEAAILYGIFSLRETLVHEVMVPRVDVTGIDRQSPWNEVLDRVRASEHSRLPVYSETLDEIVGILHAKDLLPYVLSEEAPPDGWESLVRPASFVPRTRLIGEQLRDFRASGNHMAIVVDEFGGTAGLVTIEDVLEEIVGEIRDEHDEEEPEVEVRDGTRFWLAGRVTLEEAGELLGLDLEREGISTVGGLVYEELGRVPRPGEAFTMDGFRVVVEQVHRRRVRRVYFERLDSESSGGDTGE